MEKLFSKPTLLHRRSVSAYNITLLRVSYINAVVYVRNLGFYTSQKAHQKEGKKIETIRQMIET